MQGMFLDHKVIILEISNRKISKKSPNIWRLNNTLLSNTWITNVWIPRGKGVGWEELGDWDRHLYIIDVMYKIDN